MNTETLEDGGISRGQTFSPERRIKLISRKHLVRKAYGGEHAPAGRDTRSFYL
jgi:hypothetical protein